MAAKTLHFRVGNGDMTLMLLESGRRLLVDIDIRQTTGEDLELPDVAAQLRSELSDLAATAKAAFTSTPGPVSLRPSKPTTKRRKKLFRRATRV